MFNIGRILGLGSASSLVDDVRNVKDVTVKYAKQETVEPLKSIGRILVFGLSGSIFLGIGVVLLSVGLLRALQTETGTHFTNHLSWVPYGLTVLFLALVTGLCVLAVSKAESASSKKRKQIEDFVDSKGAN